MRDAESIIKDFDKFHRFLDRRYINLLSSEQADICAKLILAQALSCSNATQSQKLETLKDHG